jgi:hypothetical protein
VPQFAHRRPLAVLGIVQGFEGDIWADLVAELETARDRLRHAEKHATGH